MQVAELESTKLYHMFGTRPDMNMHVKNLGTVEPIHAVAS